jgi:hypothetical protein
MTEGTPSWIPNRTYDEPPTWNSGIATIDLSPGKNSQPSWALTVCVTMLVWVSITPFGRPVVPEEYMTRQTSSGDTSSGRWAGVEDASQASYASPSAPSGVTSMTVSTLRSCSRILLTVGISSLPTKSTVAPQSLTA